MNTFKSIIELPFTSELWNPFAVTSDVPGTVWIFHGEDAPFASGVFDDQDRALAWVARHRLTGILTEYAVGDEGEPNRGPARRHVHLSDGQDDLVGHATPGPDDRPLWLIEIAVLATKDEVDRLTDELVATICPDSDHDGECAIPWALTAVDGGGFSPRRQAELRESIRLTNPDPHD